MPDIEITTTFTKLTSNRKGGNKKTYIWRSGNLFGFETRWFRWSSFLRRGTLIPSPSRRVQTQSPQLQTLQSWPIPNRSSPRLSILKHRPFGLGFQFILLRRPWKMNSTGSNRQQVTGHQILGITHTRPPLRNWLYPAKHGNRGSGVEASHVDELAELDLIGGDQIDIFIRNGNVSGVKRIRELQEEASALPEIVASGEGGHDFNDLQQCRSMLSEHLHILVAGI